MNKTTTDVFAAIENIHNDGEEDVALQRMEFSEILVQVQQMPSNDSIFSIFISIIPLCSQYLLVWMEPISFQIALP